MNYIHQSKLHLLLASKQINLEEFHPTSEIKRILNSIENFALEEHKPVVLTIEGLTEKDIVRDDGRPLDFDCIYDFQMVRCLKDVTLNLSNAKYLPKLR